MNMPIKLRAGLKAGNFMTSSTSVRCIISALFRVNIG